MAATPSPAKVQLTHSLSSVLAELQLIPSKQGPTQEMGGEPLCDRSTHLTKRYGDTTAVDDLTFTVQPGIVTGFLGPNGAGKSTTMRLILGLDAPTSGERHGERQALRRAPGAAARCRRAAGGPGGPHRPLGPQPSARARADARHPAQPRRRGDRPGRPAARWRASGPAGSRSAWASDWASPPRCSATRTLIFDEPVNGLDPEGIRWIRDLLQGPGRRRPHRLRLLAT